MALKDLLQRINQQNEQIITSREAADDQREIAVATVHAVLEIINFLRDRPKIKDKDALWQYLFDINEFAQIYFAIIHKNADEVRQHLEDILKGCETNVNYRLEEFSAENREELLGAVELGEYGAYYIVEDEETLEVVIRYAFLSDEVLLELEDQL